MKVLIDTNIVLDYLGANHGFTETAENVFNLSEKRKDITFVSASAITDIIFVLSVPFPPPMGQIFRNRLRDRGTDPCHKQSA